MPYYAYTRICLVDFSEPLAQWLSLLLSLLAVLHQSSFLQKFGALLKIRLENIVGHSEHQALAVGAPRSIVVEARHSLIPTAAIQAAVAI